MSTWRRIEISELDHEIERAGAPAQAAQLRARIARRPGRWRKRMQTRHLRSDEHLSPLPHAA